MDIKIKDIDDLKNIFPTENDARLYLHSIRWGQWANCHYCGNKKCYIIENGERYKCANNKCYKRFRITVGTLFESSNFSYREIISILYSYSLRRGRQNIIDFKNSINVTAKTAFFLQEKLDFALKTIDKVGKSTEELMALIFKNCCLLYEDFNNFKKSPHYLSPYHIPPDSLYDISNNQQYNILLRYTNYFISVWGRKRGIFWLDFGSAEDVLAETFLWMRDKNIKEYNTESILRYTRNTASRMWNNFLNQHPKYNEFKKNWAKEYKKERTQKLPTSLVIEYILKEKNNRLTKEEIKKMPNKIARKRLDILKKRDKLVR